MRIMGFAGALHIKLREKRLQFPAIPKALLSKLQRRYEAKKNKGINWKQDNGKIIWVAVAVEMAIAVENHLKRNATNVAMK